jgi:hypothetical protein
MGSSSSAFDVRVERVVLSLLLVNEPQVGQPISQIVEQVGDPEATLLALERLQAFGLAERNGDLVAPTPAAIRFDELGI